MPSAGRLAGRGARRRTNVVYHNRPAAPPGPRNPPVLSTPAETVWSGSAASKTTSTGGSNGAGSLTWGTGDIVIVIAMGANTAVTYGTPTTAGTGLGTFTSIAGPSAGASTCPAQVWRAVATGSGSGTVTLTSNSGATYGFAAIAAAGTDGTAAAITTSTTVTASLTTTADESAVVALIGDFGATAVTGEAATPSGATEWEASNQGNAYSVFGYTWPDRDTAGTASYGIGGTYTPNGSNYTKALVEIQGAAAGSVAVHPATVPASAGTIGATVTAGASVTPATVAATTTVGGTGLASSTVLPATVSAATTIGGAGRAGAVAAPGTVAATAAIAAPTVATTQVPTPGTVAAVAAIAAPAVTAGAGSAPATVAATAAVPAPVVRLGTTAAPGVVTGTTGIGTPTVGGPDVIAPTVPEALHATALTTTTVDMAWVAAFDAVGVTQYELLLMEVAAMASGTPYLLVAANEAPSVVKARADYVCDGTADQVEINTALASLATSNGAVILSGGDYFTTARIQVPGHGQQLLGIGTGHRSNASQTSKGTRIKAVTGFTDTEILLVQLTANDAPAHGVTLRDFTIDGDAVGTNVDGVKFRSHTASIERVHVVRCTGYGVRLRGYDATESPPSGWATYDTQLSRLLVAYNTGGGVWFDTMAQDCHLLLSVIYNNGTNVRVNAGSQQITACHTYSGTDYNVWFDGDGSRTKIVNLKCEQAGQHGVFIDGTNGGLSDVVIAASNFKNNGTLADNTYDHVFIGGPSSHSRPTITGCNFSWTAGNKPRYGVNGSSSATQNLNLTGCNFGPDTHFGTGPLNLASSATVTTAGNQMASRKTRNGGAASVANGGTITHLLARTPAIYTAVATVAGHIATVTAVSATTLTVGLTNHDGTAVTVAENVAWQAEV